MLEAIDKKFERMSGKRITFIGKVDEVKQVKKMHKKDLSWSVTFIDVVEKGTDAPFRQHVHILVDNKMYKQIFKDNLKLKEDVFSFNAEIYRYLKPPKRQKNGLIYSTHSIGLRELKNVKKINVKR